MDCRLHKETGRVLGFLGAYIVFTTVLFFILALLNKMPETWGYFHVMGITIAITAIGNGTRRVLGD